MAGSNRTGHSSASISRAELHQKQPFDNVSAGMESDYQGLKTRWLAGERDRELGLRLMFLAWMHWADPPFVTGLTDDPDAEALWRDVFAYSGGEASMDAEFLFVSGLMAELFSYALGNEDEWSQRGARMKTRALDLHPAALPFSTFENRGEYGKYFAHQLYAARSRHPDHGW
jgi:hypothetical protein